MNKKDAKKQFGKNLKKLRLEKGMSQEELALKLGYKGRSAINKIETGVNDMPRDTVVKCAQVLGVSPLVLFEEPEPKMSPIEAALKRFNGRRISINSVGGDVSFYSADEIQEALDNLDINDDKDAQLVKTVEELGNLYLQEPRYYAESSKEPEEPNPYTVLLEEFSTLSDSAREQVMNYIKFLRSQEGEK